MDISEDGAIQTPTPVKTKPGRRGPGRSEAGKAYRSGPDLEDVLERARVVTMIK